MPDKDGKETEEEWATRMIMGTDFSEPLYWTRKKPRDLFRDEEERLEREREKERS